MNRNSWLINRKSNTIIIAALCLLAAVAGCQSTPKDNLAGQVQKLTDEKALLANQLERSKTESEQLQQQVKVLSGIPQDGKPADIYNLTSIKITRYTNFYDKDRNGKKETLIVYVQPIDQDSDIIKAAGTVDVQLWNLNRPDGQALIGEWHVTAEQLKKLWVKTVLTLNYRLTFDIAGKVENFKDPLTVTVTFTDHLTGKVFKEQLAIKPREK